jgi:hypothetical protein
LLLSLYRCGGRRNACLRSRERRVAFVDLGLADCAGADQFAAPIGSLGRQSHLGHVRALLGFGLPNEGMLKLDVRIDIGETGLGSFDIGLC